MKRILFGILITFMFMINTKASSSNLIVNCPSSQKALENVKCSLYVKSDDFQLSGIQLSFNFQNINFVSFEANKNYIAYSSNINGIVLKRNTPSDINSQDLIGTLNLKMSQSNSGTVKFTNIITADNDYNEYMLDDKTINIRVKSSENRLSNINVSQGTLSPSFDSSVTSYSLNVDTDKITIKSSALDKYSTITGDGVKTLKYGKNTVNITCTSELGIKRIYTINIIRKDIRDSNNYLKSLKVGTYIIKPDFNKDTTVYKLDVKNDVLSVYIDAQTDSLKSSFVPSYGSRSVNLKYGNNDFDIKVKSENEQVKTYTIKINREDNRSSNNYLKNIIISSGTIKYDKNKNTYSFTVENNVDKLEVKSILEDNKSKVTEDKTYNLKEGLNKIYIKVVAENTQERIYTLFVTRIVNNKKEINNKIKSLEIDGYQINFNPDIEEYNITIENEESLNINAISEDPSSSLVINGNSNLKDGSVIKIVLTAIDGSKKEYKINILKNEIYKKPIKQVQETVQLSKYRKLQITLGVVFSVITLVLIVLIIILIIKRNIGKLLT